MLKRMTGKIEARRRSRKDRKGRKVSGYKGSKEKKGGDFGDDRGME